MNFSTFITFSSFSLIIITNLTYEYSLTFSHTLSISYYFPLELSSTSSLFTLSISTSHLFSLAHHPMQSVHSSFFASFPFPFFPLIIFRSDSFLSFSIFSLSLFLLLLFHLFHPKSYCLWPNEIYSITNSFFSFVGSLDSHLSSFLSPVSRCLDVSTLEYRGSFIVNDSKLDTNSFI